MTSDFEAFCGVLIAELTKTVPKLGQLPSEQIHSLVPWNPEELEAREGERHLAVWPMTEGETTSPLDSNDHLLDQRYAVLVWEGAATESARQRLDEQATSEFLELHNAVRARFYVNANQQLGASMRVWYVGTTFPERSSSVRWFATTIQRLIPIGFS